MTESILASIVDKTGWHRSIVLLVLSVVGFLFGLIFITEGGFNWLGTLDGFVNGTWGITFMGLLECVVLGWLWRIGTLRQHANSRSDWILGKWWDYLIRLVIPVVLGTLFFWQLFDDNPLKREFWKTADGEWILTNCIGLGILAFVPIVAVVLSLARGRTDIREPERPEQNLVVGGRSEGAIAFFAALGIAVLLILLLTVPISQAAKQVILWLLLVSGVVTMLLSNYVLDKHHTSTSQASWLARWAGITAAMDISASIAIILIGLADGAEIEKTTATIRDRLSGVSYIILAVVFLIIIGGLGWCFYKALAAASGDTGIQHPDEIGDERRRI
jgi:NSS family neurotransmitter:Na+ symporter